MAPVLMLAFALAAPVRAQVTFVDRSLDEALTDAAAHDKLVLVDVYATWCGPCHRLDAEVFPTPLVGDAAANMVSIRIDAERGEGPALVERYHVVGYPTVLLLRADGEEIDRVFGFHPAEDFASLLTGYQDGSGTIDALHARALSDPTNLELQLELAERTLVRGDVARGEALFRSIIEADPANEAGLRTRAHLFLGKYGYLRSRRDYAAAVAEFDVILQQFPGSPQGLSAQLQAGIALLRAGDEPAAFERFDAAIATSPQDPGLYNAVAFTTAREGRGLTRGAELARRGLELAPDDASLWDTYAEVLSASGDAAGALAAIDEAVRLAPEEGYYQQQRARFAEAAATP